MFLGSLCILFQFMSHDYSHQSTKEDPRMMAFFDSLVQREIEGWSSEGSVSSEVSATGYAETFQDALVSPSSDSESAHSGKRVNVFCQDLLQFLNCKPLK